MHAANDNANGYRVIHKGQVVANYYLFVDAWLYAKLECQYWTKISGPDGTWIINPFSRNGDIMSRSIILSDFLSMSQLDRAKRLLPDREAIRDQVILPNMAEINRKLDQENDPDYLSYLVVYALQIGARRANPA